MPSYQWPEHVSAFLGGPSLRVAMYAYLDESGKFHDGQGFICLCGFLSWDAGWTTFDNKWRLLLARHGLPFIHMTTFYSDCRAKGLNDERATEILKDFIDAIRKSPLIGFAVGVDGKYFKNRSRQAGMNRDPAIFAIHRILRQMRDASVQITKSQNVVSRIALTFDEDEAYSIQCYKLISRLRKIRPEIKETIISVAFADDEWYSPLQAADILANFTNRYWRDNMDAPSPEPPEMLKRLLTPPEGGDNMFMWQESEWWSQAEIDKHWSEIQAAKDMP